MATLSGGACAQSSVAVYGILDTTVRYVKNGDQKLWLLGSGGQLPSRLGFRGTEELGGGLKAGFWVETGLNVDSGTQADASRFWNRRTTVSLLGDFGELRLGRDFTPTYGGYTDFDPFLDSGVAFASKFDSSLGTARDTGTRSDNQVAYLTPGTLGGFYGRFAVAPSEGQGCSTLSRAKQSQQGLL
jgi:predicted porin